MHPDIPTLLALPLAITGLLVWRRLARSDGRLAGATQADSLWRPFANLLIMTALPLTEWSWLFWVAPQIPTPLPATMAQRRIGRALAALACLYYVTEPIEENGRHILMQALLAISISLRLGARRRFGFSQPLTGWASVALPSITLAWGCFYYLPDVERTQWTPYASFIAICVFAAIYWWAIITTVREKIQATHSVGIENLPIANAPTVQLDGALENARNQNAYETSNIYNKILDFWRQIKGVCERELRHLPGGARGCFPAGIEIELPLSPNAIGVEEPFYYETCRNYLFSNAGDPAPGVRTEKANIPQKNEPGEDMICLRYDLSKVSVAGVILRCWAPSEKQDTLPPINAALLSIAAWCDAYWAGYMRRHREWLLEREVNIRTRELRAARDALEIEKDTQYRWFLAINHDLKSPLSAMQSRLDQIHEALTAQQSFAPERIRQWHNGLEFGVRRLGLLIDSILTSGLIRAGRYPIRNEALRLADVSRDMRREFGFFLEQKKLTMEADIPETIVIQADPAVLYRVFGNIYSNLYKYAPRQSRVIIMARTRGRRCKLRVINESAPYNRATLRDWIRPLTKGAPSHSSPLGPAAIHAQSHGLGLRGVRELMSMAGGRFFLYPLPGSLCASLAFDLCPAPN